MTSSEPRPTAGPRRPTLLVIGDSLSYYGPKGGLPADHPRIWPNIVARDLDWDVELVARIGWTTRDAWWAMTQDPRVWATIPVALPPRVSVDYLETIRESLAYMRPDLPVIATLPSVHRSEQYRGVHRGRPAAAWAINRWASEKSVPLVDLGEAVHADIHSGDANPDGIHWGWNGHSEVAAAVAEAVRMVRRDARVAAEDIR